MKKKILFAFILLMSMYATVKAQVPAAADTIYIRAYQETEIGKFYAVIDNQLSISFAFKVNWKLHDGQLESILLSYYSPKKGDKINRFSIPVKEKLAFANQKNYYTLDQFTKELGNNVSFRLALPNKQLILLYGSKCADKVELYPVKVATDLSTEG